MQKFQDVVAELAERGGRDAPARPVRTTMIVYFRLLAG